MPDTNNNFRNNQPDIITSPGISFSSFNPSEDGEVYESKGKKKKLDSTADKIPQKRKPNLKDNAKRKLII